MKFHPTRVSEFLTFFKTDLDFYRNSEFFRDVWIQTKTYFSMPAEAWSLSEVTY